MFRVAFKNLVRELGYEIKKSTAGHLAQDPFDVQGSLLRDFDRLTIFDLGAHRGQTTKEYALKFPNATIYGFEPFPESFKELQEVAAAYDGVRPYCLAMTDSTARRTLYISHRSATNSLLPRPEDQRRYFPSNAEMTGKIQVETSTLDAFCQQASISRINILKMDIQGGELLALKGASDLLSEGRIDLIFTEVMFVPHYEGGPLFYELWEFVARYSYSLYDLFIGTYATNGQLRQGDAIFISHNRRTNIVNAFGPEP